MHWFAFFIFGVLWLSVDGTYVSIGNSTLIEDHDLTLTCKSKNATGQKNVVYHWWHNKGQSKNEKYEWLIKNASRTDSGNYSCLVIINYNETLNETLNNIVYEYSVEIDVTILYLDVPVLSVSNSKPAEGVDNVTFTCTANTTDNINRYTWLYNGTEIDGESNQTYQLTGGNRNNTGGYSCNVKTDKALEKTSVVETVTFMYLDGPVDINISPPIAREGVDIVNFTCSAKDSNDLFIHNWYLDGKYVFYSSSVILLLYENRSYTGNYTCGVTTAHGNVPIRSLYSKNLKYLWMDIDPKPPANKTVEVDVQSNYDVNCSGYFAIPPTKRTSFHWKKDGKILQNVTDGDVLTLHLNNINLNDYGVYVCETNNSDGQVQSHNFTLLPLCKVDMGNITLVRRSATTIAIEWRNPVACTEEHPVPTQNVTSYTLYLRNMASDVSHIPVIITNMTWTLHEFTVLVADTLYEVKMSATNRNGEGANSTLQVNTSDASAPGQPSNLNIGENRGKKITLDWGEPDPTNGKILRYHACYTMTRFDGEPQIENETCKTTKASIFHCEFDGLGDYNTYNVSVMAENSAGNGSAALKQVTTDEGKPMGVHITLNASVVNQISIAWQRPEHIYGKFKGYLAYKYPDIYDHPLANCTIDHCVVANLHPFRNYTFGVYAMNHGNNGKLVPKSVMTQPTLPPYRPKPIPLSKPSESGIRKNAITIQLIEFSEENGRFIRYDVIVMPCGEDGSQPSMNASKITNKKIKNGDDGLFIAGKISDRKKFGKSFVIGGGSVQAWGSRKHLELKHGTYYAVFLRGYVKEDTMYISTTWYPVVKTLETLSGGDIAGIVIGILLIVVIVVGVVLCRRRRRLNNGKGYELKWKKDEQNE